MRVPRCACCGDFYQAHLQNLLVPFSGHKLRYLVEVVVLQSLGNSRLLSLHVTIALGIRDDILRVVEGERAWHELFRLDAASEGYQSDVLASRDVFEQCATPGSSRQARAPQASDFALPYAAEAAAGAYIVLEIIKVGKERLGEGCLCGKRRERRTQTLNIRKEPQPTPISITPARDLTGEMPTMLPQRKHRVQRTHSPAPRESSFTSARYNVRNVQRGVEK